MHYFFFFFNDTATTEIYTLSLHDALPISEVLDGRVLNLLGTRRLARPGRRRRVWRGPEGPERVQDEGDERDRREEHCREDRKSTRLNSSHANISYAVFCLKKKKTHKTTQQ